MIVTTGRIIKISVCRAYRLERTSEAPGIVVVTNHTYKDEHEKLTLPANPSEMEAFIDAYRRACTEQVGYREMENE